MAKSKGKLRLSTIEIHRYISDRAYYISVTRMSKNLPGDEVSDWLQAEKEIVDEAQKLKDGKSSKGITKEKNLASPKIEKSSAASEGLKARVKKLTKKIDKSPDLRDIKGVGKVFANKLAKIGIHSLEQVAAWSEYDANAADEKVGLLGRPVRENWIKQAKRLIGK